MISDESEVRVGRGPLFAWRSNQRMTQAQAAALFGMQVAVYQRYENGDLPKLQRLWEIEQKTGVKGMAASLVLYHFGITAEDAEPYFKMLDMLGLTGAQPAAPAAEAN